MRPTNEERRPDSEYHRQRPSNMNDMLEPAGDRTPTKKRRGSPARRRQFEAAMDTVGILGSTVTCDVSQGCGA
jgi:hypothetical protein